MSESEADEQDISSESRSSNQSASPRNHTQPNSPSKKACAQSVSIPMNGCDQIIAINQDERVDCSAIGATLRLDNSGTAWRICKEPCCIWVDTDYEQDATEAALTKYFGRESFFSVRGATSAERKESEILGWIDGDRPLLISKPSICGFGMNFQHCARTVFVGRSFSYESWYQAVRRFWRFGQKREVHVHLIVAEGEDSIGRVIDRKADDHDEMKIAMRAAMRRNDGKNSATRVAYTPNYKGSLPSWIA
jgi:hypothetical protein